MKGFSSTLRKHIGVERLHQFFVSLATIVFLAKYFISRGPTTSVEHVVNLSSLELIVIAFVFLVEVFIVRRAIEKKVFFAVSGFLILYISCLMHVYFSAENFHYGYFVKATRLSGYILIVLIFSLVYFQWPTLRKYFICLTYASILFAICSNFFFPEYFSDLGYSFSRPRAFFSEPSTFAPVLAFGLYYSLKRKSIFWVISSMLGIYLVASGTVYFVVVLVGFALALKFFLVGWGRGADLSKALATLLLFIIVIFTIIFSPVIDQSMSGTFNYKRSKAAIKSLTQKGEGSSRLVSLFNYYDVLSRDGDLLFGKGLNSAQTYFGENSKLNKNREYSILHSFLFSFGIIGTLLLGFILGGIFFVLMRSSRPDVYLFYCCFLFSSLINSSGGHTLYKFLYLFIFLVFLSPSRLGLNFIIRPSREVNCLCRNRVGVVSAEV